MNIREYIRDCDKNFSERLKGVADAIASGKDRVICLCGPTCSGKTTAATMLSARLKDYGRDVHVISIDDFYYDRDYLNLLSERKGLDGIDYDSVDTIDLGALGEFVREVFCQEEIHCPVFDFKSGTRVGVRTVKAKETDLFIFEGIQAIYPQVTELFGPIGYVSVYIAPLRALSVNGDTVSPNRIRLLRRLVRDSTFRGANAEFTLKLWESVRANEEKNIFPFVESCNYKIDSTHDYELGILRPYLEGLLQNFPSDSKYSDKVKEILIQMSAVEPISSALIEGGSLYLEFV